MFARAKLFMMLSVFIVCLAHTTTAQVKRRESSKNVLLFEGLGSGVLYSVCYERFFVRREHFIMAYHVGFSKFSSRLSEGRYIPVELLGMTGRNHHFEFGCGLDFQRWRLTASNDPYITDQFLILRLGYRYQKPEGSFMFRAGVVTLTADGGGIIWPAIAAGYAF